MKFYLALILCAIFVAIAFADEGYRFKRHPPFGGYHDGHRGGSRFEEREYERSRYGGRGGGHGGRFEERGFERRHGGGFGGRGGGGFEEREYERTRYGGHGGRDFDRHGDRGYGIGGGRGGIRGGGLGPRDVGSSTITETRGPLGNTHTSVVTNKVSPPHFG